MCSILNLLILIFIINYGMWVSAYIYILSPIGWEQVTGGGITVARAVWVYLHDMCGSFSYAPCSCSSETLFSRDVGLFRTM